MKRFYLLTLCLFALSTQIQARVVDGIVKCGKKKLSEVVVTDGKNFTQTKQNGKFTFEIEDDAQFVYIVTPSGYVADWSTGVPAFYQESEGKDEFVFELQAFGQGEMSYNLIAVGDPQPRSDEHFDEFADIPLNDIKETVSELNVPTVGIALGDMCFDVFHLLGRWKENIVRTGIPFYPVIGNHDHDKQYNNDYQSPLYYRSLFGPENYAFMIGNDLVIILDDIIYHQRSGYEEGYTDAIVDWVDGLMEYIPEDADIYVAQHSPLNGRHYTKMITNHQEMLDALEGHKVTFLSGHNHTSGYFEYTENVSEHNIAAICGTWWDVYYCTDGTPRGYKVLTKKDGHLSWYYKSVGRDKDFQYEVYKPGEARLNPKSLVVNVWDYDPCWRVEWYQDGEYKGIMQRVHEYSPYHERDLKAFYDKLGREPSNYKKTRRADHYFAARPSETAEVVTVKVTTRFGKVLTQVISLK